MVTCIGDLSSGECVDSRRVSPGRRSAVRGGDACGYVSRSSATTPACGRGEIKRVALVVIMLKL
jgi:hypothetical protein